MPVRAHSVVVLVTKGAPVFETSVPCEVFGIDRPDLASPWYRFAMIGLGDGPIRLAGGLVLPADHSPAQKARLVAQADTVIVPACADIHAEPPSELVEVVRGAHRRGARLLSICSGAFVLAAAGLLEGRRATTHWMHAPELAQRYPGVEVDASVLYIEDGSIITSAGTAAGLDACVHLVRLDHGAAVAAELARRLVVPPHREGGQAQFSPLPPATTLDADHWLVEVLSWLEGELHRPLVSAELAAMAHVSVRTLERRFIDRLGLSPLQWQLRRRVRRAQELLETTDLSVDAIVRDCGFGTGATMRMHFARLVGLSPSAYRRQFRGSPATTIDPA